MPFSPQGRLPARSPPARSPAPAPPTNHSPGPQLTAASQAPGRAPSNPSAPVFNAGGIKVDGELFEAFQNQPGKDMLRSPKIRRRPGANHVRRTTPPRQAQPQAQPIPTTAPAAVVRTGGAASTPATGPSRTAVNPLADLLKTAKPAANAVRGGGFGKTSTPLGRHIARKQASNFRQPALNTPISAPGGFGGNAAVPGTAGRNFGQDFSGYAIPQNVHRPNNLHSRFVDGPGHGGDPSDRFTRVEADPDAILSSDEDNADGNGAPGHQSHGVQQNTVTNNNATVAMGASLRTPRAPTGLGIFFGAGGGMNFTAGDAGGSIAPGGPLALYGSPGSRPVAQQEAFLATIPPPSARVNQRQRSRLAGGASGNGLHARVKRIRAADDDHSAAVASAPPGSQQTLQCFVEGQASEAGVLKVRGVCTEDGTTMVDGVLLLTTGNPHLRDLEIKSGDYLKAFKPYRCVNGCTNTGQRVFTCMGKVETATDLQQHRAS